MLKSVQALDLECKHMDGFGTNSLEVLPAPR